MVRSVVYGQTELFSWDLPGRRGDLGYDDEMAGIDGIMLVVDATDEARFNRVQELMQKLLVSPQFTEQAKKVKRKCILFCYICCESGSFWGVGVAKNSYGACQQAGPRGRGASIRGGASSGPEVHQDAVVYPECVCEAGRRRVRSIRVADSLTCVATA